MADVAAAAGVSKATVFHHYRSKQRLYESLVDDAVQGFRETLVPLLDSQDDLQASLESFVAAHVARLSGLRGTMRLLMRGILDGSSRSTRALAASGVAHNFALVVDALRRAQARGAMRPDADPGLAAIVLLWTTWFVVQHGNHVLRNPQLATFASPAAYSSEFSRLLWRGLAPGRATRPEDAP